MASMDPSLDANEQIFRGINNGDVRSKAQRLCERFTQSSWTPRPETNAVTHGHATFLFHARQISNATSHSESEKKTEGPRELSPVLLTDQVSPNDNPTLLSPVPPQKPAQRRSSRKRHSQVNIFDRRVSSRLGKRPDGSLPHPEEPLNISSSVSSILASQQTPSQSLGKWHGARRLFREIHGGNFENSIYSAMASNFTSWRWWKGASNDVVSLAWSPDGTKFAAGATTHDDDYNRGNNLVLGDLARNSLTELPGHWVPHSNQFAPGADDTRHFTTVSASEWIGQHLYTASYDHTVKIWDIKNGQGVVCIETLMHDSKVVAMAHSNHPSELLATATQSFRLWDLRDKPTYMSLPIMRGSHRKEIDLAPTVLAWGQTADTDRILVGGMMERSQHDIEIPLCGHLQVWSMEESSISTRKVTPDSQHIFDIKWHPTMAKFVTAGTSLGMAFPRSTRSVVQIYDLSSGRSLVTSRFACPALDINEVTFCPRSSYVTASCTDGSTYVWDDRNPHKLLHRLPHGISLSPLSHEHSSECVDVGVSVALWGPVLYRRFRWAVQTVGYSPFFRRCSSREYCETR